MKVGGRGVKVGEDAGGSGGDEGGREGGRGCWREGGEETVVWIFGLYIYCYCYCFHLCKVGKVCMFV